MSSVAIYVHIPWCASLCPYCDFDKQATDFRLVDAYVEALERHIGASPPRVAHSLFFGGGTPSLLTPARLGKVIDACKTRFGGGQSWEVTVEANPSDVVAHKIAAYLDAGVTRISLGVQSLDDAELRFLGRRHTADKARRAVAAIREAGCRDVSLDLMYGLPMSSGESVERSLAGLVELGPDHLSCYALTLEPETPMGAQADAGQIALLGDDAVADQYEAIQMALESAGFGQYELSNWARPEHQSRHNLTYWRNGEWIGLGAGAAGSAAGTRYKRTPDVREYIRAAAAGEPALVFEEAWSLQMQMRDTVMLGLRLAEGVGDADFGARFGVALREYLGGEIPPSLTLPRQGGGNSAAQTPPRQGGGNKTRLDDLVRAGVLGWDGDRLCLAPTSYFICNAVLGEILPDLDQDAP